MKVRQLGEQVINQIAAGEVIERPASVIKELVENAVDAGAKQVEIVTAAGGKTLMRVADDGEGMRQEDLQLAIRRHCTSKISDDDLFDIRTLGFRGEALPSIGSVARLAIQTRHKDEDHAWAIAVEGGREQPLVPAARTKGTQVEVRDLFFATPARLKFLKSDRAEAAAITEIVKRIALAYPEIGFSSAAPTGSRRAGQQHAAVNRILLGSRRFSARILSTTPWKSTLPGKACVSPVLQDCRHTTVAMRRTSSSSSTVAR